MAPLPDGQHTGEITNCEETTVTFDPAKGPEEVVRITMQSDAVHPDGLEYMSVSAIFTPNLNGVSALSRCLDRLGRHPEDGEDFDAAACVGTRVSFTTKLDEKDDGNAFTNVAKASIRAIE